VPGENALRGEHAFYRLASGSNMAYRIERTFRRDDPLHPTPLPATLPERRSYDTASELLQLWPTLQEVTWWDPAARVPRGGARVGGVTLGDGSPLPRHGAVVLVFSEDITVTIVGSHDDTYAGPVRDDFGNTWSGAWILPVPPHARTQQVWELLCGLEGADWDDADGDTAPDACGRDLDGDGTRDTGLWTGCGYVGLMVRVDAAGMPSDSSNGAYYDGLFMRERNVGGRIDLAPGHAYDMAAEPGYAWEACPGGGLDFNVPFRPPTW
jgi:hypothetical protein